MQEHEKNEFSSFVFGNKNIYIKSLVFVRDNNSTCAFYFRNPLDLQNK